MTQTIEISEADTPDRFVPCDHCGHRSYYFVTLESGRELSYYRHAYLKYMDKLWESAVTIVDMSHLV